jgi:hypothetical protein
MATYTKLNLSASSNGRPIAVAATSSSGTLLHTAHATAKDEVWLYATNISSGAVDLTIEFGGTSASDRIIQSIPAKSGLAIDVPGVPLTGGVAVRAYAGTASVINIVGWVNRIS